MFKRKVQLHCNGANDDVRGTDDDDYGGGYIFDGYERACGNSLYPLPPPPTSGWLSIQGGRWLVGWCSTTIPSLHRSDKVLPRQHPLSLSLFLIGDKLPLFNVC